MYTISTINVGAYMLGELEQYPFFPREKICNNILHICKEHHIDIICTQEDVLIESNNGIVPEFKELYESYNYFCIVEDILCDSHSKTINNIHKNKQPKLGNVIYVKSHLKKMVGPIKKRDEKLPACIAQMCFGYITIANIHLCGGRFDDEIVFKDSGFFKTKLKSIESLGNSIICGDFNATRLLNKPGGLKNMDYPYELAKKYNSSFFPEQIVDVWNTWQCEPIEHFYQDLRYVSALSEQQLEIINETSSRGKTVVDWVFYNHCNIGKHDSDCIKMYASTKNTFQDIADHHMVKFEFTINDFNPSSSRRTDHIF